MHCRSSLPGPTHLTQQEAAIITSVIAAQQPAVQVIARDLPRNRGGVTVDPAFITPPARGAVPTHALPADRAALVARYR